MKNDFIFAAMAVVLAACQPNNGMSTKGYRSINPSISIANQAGIAFKNPHQTAWVQSTKDTHEELFTQVFACNDASCAPPTLILYSRFRLNTPVTGNCSCIDAEISKINENYANLGRTITVQPQKGKYKSYDTIYYQWSKKISGKTLEGYYLWILTGKEQIYLEGRAYNKTSSQKAVEHFLSMIEIEDGGL